jgi:hypothetical protein
VETWEVKMTWLATKTFFKKTWCFIQKYWKYLVALFYALGMWMYFRNSSQKPREILDNAKDSFDKQIEVINKSHEEELERKADIAKKYDETIEILEKKHAERELELSEKKKKRVKEILNKHHSNPASLAYLMSREFGIEYVPNKEGEE